MTHVDIGPATLWLMVFLGAYHGINPGMGWLFAVALGMQEESGHAVARALIPIAIGHGVAIGSVALIAAFAGMTVPIAFIRYPVAAILIALGIHYLVRHRHPRWVRMRVSMMDLVVWSFLMASAHGAGLMVVPVLLGAASDHATGPTATHAMSTTISTHDVLIAAGVHTISYLATTALLAWVVYRKLGLALLRKAWFNLDMIWSFALIVTGLITLLT